jgi:hypothetical protein
MCEYSDGLRVYRSCTKRPRHLVTARIYEVCQRQQEYGIQKHCVNCTNSGHASGISPVMGPCPTCRDETVTAIEVIYAYFKFCGEMLMLKMY